MFSAFLIKYAEIGIKGKNRYLFEDALVKQIRHALKKTEGEFEVTKTQGRIYIECLKEFDIDDVVAKLQCVFGITGICPVVHVEDQGFDQLKADIVDYIKNVHPEGNKTFKIHARRARKDYPMESMEINAELGGVILDAFPDMKVDVHDPEILLCVEIRE
ncbi:MAG: tRNA 4-thiouridine(8) synthase ThiI, partial [Clostridia bacterium]|nr:tRNA 4-thiouridine(8) synthase ThiI [Clostridia bacterium]